VLRLAHAAALASGTVTPQAGGTLAVAGALQTTVASLVPGAGGLVDVGTGMVTVDRGLTSANLVTAIVAGLGDGTWSGTSGITSSQAAIAAGAGIPRSIGWLDNGDGSVTFAFAAPGDTNLDWTIDLLDVGNYLGAARLDTGETSTWGDGDYTYDGIVDLLDVSSFLSADLFDVGPYNGAGLAPVPEPWLSVALVPLIAAACMRRRSR